MADNDGFVRMELPQAQDECRQGDNYETDRCGKCSMTVLLHCSTCKIQVTGCFCSEVDRFGTSEALERMIERVGEEEARRIAAKSGLWTPPLSH